VPAREPGLEKSGFFCMRSLGACTAGLPRGSTGLFIWSLAVDVLDLLKLHEGFRRTVYQCTESFWTLGYGRNVQTVGLTREEAEFLLRNDISRARASCEHEVYWSALDDVRRAVIIDMVINVGWSKFATFIRMRDAVRQEDYVRAAAEMLNSKWAGQVGDRARRLATMMRTGEWPS